MTRTDIPTLALMSMLLLSSAALAETPGVAAIAVQDTCEIPHEHKMFKAPNWYGLYWGKAKVGHYWGEARFTADGHIETDYVIDMTLGKTKFSAAETRRFAGASPHLLLNGHLVKSGQRIDYQQSDQSLNVQADDQTLRLPDTEWTLCDEETYATDKALSGNLKIGDRFETTYLDISNLTIVTQKHLVENIEKQKIQKNGQQIEHIFHTLLTGAKMNSINTRMRQRYRDGNAVTLMLGELEARLESREQALQPVQDTDQIELLTIPIKPPLEPTRLHEIGLLAIKVSIDDPLLNIQDVIQDGVMQRVNYLDERSALVHVADHPPQSLSDEPIGNYLIANFTYPADHPRIRSMAKQIRQQLPEQASSRAQANAILRHAASYIRYQLVGTTSVLQTLDTKVGDCTEYAQLFVSLARASGLPAREVAGFIYTGDSTNGTVGGHAWVEVFVDGQWISMDPTGNEIDSNRAHIQFTNFMVAGLTFDIQQLKFKP